jgi:PAS domain S-box-containing protein
LYASAAALRLLGHDEGKNLVGQPMTSFLDAEGVATMRQRLMEMRKTGVKPAPLEYAAKRSDGSTVVAEISSIFIEYEGGPAVLAFARDVTERVRLRAQLEQANRLSALGLMAGGIAHEINNPLAFVSLAAELLEQRLEAGASSEVRDLVRDVRSGVARIAAIARDLRSYGRYEDESPSPVDLARVLDSAERMIDNEIRTRVRLRRESPDSLPPVLGVETKLEQVFVNLLLNAAYAIDHARTNGEIVIRVEPRAADVVVEIADNGMGMPPDLLAKIFQPFFTTRSSAAGTGLGLSISRDIVLRAGGTIGASSEEGRGTVVQVTLMRASQDVPRATTRTAPSMPEARRAPTGVGPREIPRRRVLVIDDEPLVVSMLVRALGKRHDVVGEVTARAGLERLLEDPSFDLVLCDLMMPELTGMDIHARVARERPGLEQRIVFITGGSFTPRAREFLDHVTNGRLMKPFTSRDLDPWLLDPPRGNERAG